MTRFAIALVSQARDEAHREYSKFENVGSRDTVVVWSVSLQCLADNAKEYCKL